MIYIDGIFVEYLSSGQNLQILFRMITFLKVQGFKKCRKKKDHLTVSRIEQQMLKISHFMLQIYILKSLTEHHKSRVLFAGQALQKVSSNIKPVQG